MKKLLIAIILMNSALGYAAEQTTPPEKIALCSACHGTNGISTNPAWPNLAGQHTRYLIKQLNDYKQVKTRDVPTMTSIAATLTEQDMAELSKYYAKQPLPEGKTPEKYVKRGGELYRGGDLDKKISACIACHGPRGIGNAEANFPVLSGQNADYIIQQLQAFKDGKRTNDLNSIMRDISARMSTEDMTAVAYYIQGLY